MRDHVLHLGAEADEVQVRNGRLSLSRVVLDLVIVLLDDHKIQVFHDPGAEIQLLLVNGLGCQGRGAVVQNREQQGFPRGVSCN